MRSSLGRRDFLKAASALPLGMGMTPLLGWPRRALSVAPDNQNILVVVFDAFSAYNMSLHGYARETTPNVSRLAKRAIVYHNHYSGSNFTTPGTASLLTGTLPWTHRALQIDSEVVKPYATRNLFSAFPEYHRVAYSHNILAYTLLRQFRRDVDDLIPWAQLLLRSYLGFVGSVLGADQDIATVWGARGLRMGDDGYAYSLFLAHIYEAVRAGEVPQELKEAFPRGVPTTGTDSDFLLEQAVDWTAQYLASLPQPFLGYFHFFPPHGPYSTALEFFNRFRRDDYQPPDKPVSPLDLEWRTNYAQVYRREYDEFILYVDREFARLFEMLETSGILDNTWLVVTSDHGEMFERGVRGHGVNTLYEPVIKVPLLIFEPGRTTGVDVHEATSAVDVLPTLAHVTGHPLPAWGEGGVLPPFAAAGSEPARPVYVVQAEKTRPGSPMRRVSIAMIKGKHKLHYYSGYTDLGVDELVELYDLQTDPEELQDLSGKEEELAGGMLSELKARWAEADERYA